MTVLIVIACFAVFLTIDYFLSRKKAPAHIEVPATVIPVAATAPRLTPALVAGFQLPANLRYHPGHMWAVSETPTMVRVGLDDFATRLAGKLDRIALPQRGQWVRQGQKVATLHRDGATAAVVSPIEGTVTEVNPAVLENPELTRNDPYGDGWLIRVNSPDATTNFRNLIGGALAKWWTEDSALRLRRFAPNAVAALAQDGGVALDDLTAGLTSEQWEQRMREFLLG